MPGTRIQRMNSQCTYHFFGKSNIYILRRDSPDIQDQYPRGRGQCLGVVGMTQMKAENDIAAVAIAHVGWNTRLLGTRPGQPPNCFNDPVAQAGPWATPIRGLGEEVDRLEWRGWTRRSDAGTRGDGGDGWAEGRKEEDRGKDTHRGVRQEEGDASRGGGGAKKD